MIPRELQVKDMVVFSGDTVYQDEDGDIYYKYRKDDMIKSSGYRISPTEIEDVLYKSGYIKHAVVFGIPEPVLGQKICGVVSLKKDNDVTSREIISFCASILPNYMKKRSRLSNPCFPIAPYTRTRSIWGAVLAFLIMKMIGNWIFR